MENTYISSSPTKKFGMLLPKKLHPRMSQSSHLSCRTADKIPSGTEIKIVRRMERTVSSRVAGSLERNVENTSCPDM